MIRHVVLIKFKADAPGEATDHFIAVLNRFPQEAPDIQDWTTGKREATNAPNGDFDFAVVCDFSDRAAFDRFATSAYRSQMGQALRPVQERLVAFDFGVDYGPESGKASV